MSQRTYYSEEARKTAQRQQFILAMAVAGISLSLGALVALLFAPDTGENIRNEIRSVLDDIAEQSGDSAKDVFNNVSGQTHEMREQVKTQIKNIRGEN